MGDHLVDIFDDCYHHTGVLNKRQAHQEGLWHRIFACLVVNPANQTVLLQKKFSDNYKDYAFQPPDYADITVAGHYEAGEAIESGVRELHEEIGLTSVSYHDLFSLGIRQTSATLTENYIERAFQHLHLLACDLDLANYTLNNDEVSGLLEIGINDAIALAAGDVAEVPMRHLRWPKGAPHGEVVAGQLSRTELIPNFLRMDQFYLRMFVSARRYLNGERQYLFW